MKTDKYGFYHLNVNVTERADEQIRRVSQERGMTVTDFIIEKATTLQIPDSRQFKKLKAKYPKNYREQAKAFLEDIKKKNGEEIMNRPNGASKKTAQFHLRVTPETYQIIQEKSEAMAMSVSDYVTFVTTRFDIEEISAKMDKVISMLESKNEGCDRA
jgi:uncharacterized protein (DUF1778 family)